MKKQLLRMSLLAVVFTVLLCVAALAAEPEQSGIYDVKSDSGVTVTPDGAKSDVAIGGVQYNDFYAGAEKMAVTLEGATDGAYYAVFVTNTQGVPTADNLVYIDQVTASQGVADFETVYPSKLENGGTYYVYITGGDRTFDAKEPAATLRYFEAYILGDVDGNKSVTVGDVTRLMQHLANLPGKELTGVRLKAADADRSGQVTVGDVTKLMQYLAGIVTTL